MKIRIKKTIFVLLVVLLATMLFVSMASAKTANKDLPTRYEVLNFVDSYQGQYFSVDTISADSEYFHPTWTWDIWKNKYGDKVISFYYRLSHNKYGSIYFDSEGNQISNMGKLKLIKSYRGT